jgi:hypothetical protein
MNIRKVGEVVDFKSDHEQSGRIIKVKPSRWGVEYVLEALGDRGFSGDYIGGNETHEVLAKDCWSDED